MKMDNKSLENVAKFYYLVTTLTKEKLHAWRNREEIKSGKYLPPFDPGFLSSHLESKSTGTEIDCSIILPVVLGCVNWSLALREESGLRIFERKVPRKVKGLKSGRAQVTGKNCIIMGITSHRIFYVLLTVHLTIILGNDQLDTQLLYFTICLLWSSTCFEHYMLSSGGWIVLMQHLFSSLWKQVSGLTLLAYNLLQQIIRQ